MHSLTPISDCWVDGITLAHQGSSGVVASFESREQEITGSNPTITTGPERGALRIPFGLCNPFRSTEEGP